MAEMDLGQSSGSPTHGWTPQTQTNNAVENTVAEAKSGPSSYSFPSDLQQIQFYPEQIKFSIYERLGIDLKNLKKTILDDKASFVNSDKPVKEAEEEFKSSVFTDDPNGLTAEQQRKAATKNIDELREKTKKTLGGQIFDTGAKLITQIKEGVEIRQGQNTKLKSSIYLPMPKEAAYNESVSWASSELGAVGAVLQGGLKDAAAGVALASAAMGAGGAAGGILGKLMGSGVGGAVIGAIASDGVQKGIESAVGIKSNPYKEQTFEGIDFRKFSFSWTFNPASQTEVKELGNIIRTFRALSKPSFKGGSGIFHYPHEYQIEFLTYTSNGIRTKGSDETLDTNPHLPQVKYCVCTAVNTNFATKEWRSFEGGAPIEVSLQLDFEETELITQDDVMGSTSIGRFKETGRTF
jgi:hypothetical protein